MPDDAREQPEEYFLDGPVQGGDDLLHRTIARVHRHAARSARLRLALLAVTVVVAGALVMGSGMMLGQWMKPPGPVGIAVVATDPSTGARLGGALTSADGGSRIDVTVTGVPVGTVCRLTLIDTAGKSMPDGSWRVAADRGAVSITAWWPPAAIRSVLVTTSSGSRLSAPIHAG